MTVNDTDMTTEAEDEPADDTATEDAAADVEDQDQADDDRGDEDTDTFPREVVEKLRRQNARYRERAKTTDAYAKRLHAELVRATGRLADPSDLEFDEDHLDDPDALAAAIDDLLDRKPHLASRKPVGDIRQGARGNGTEQAGLLSILKGLT